MAVGSIDIATTRPRRQFVVIGLGVLVALLAGMLNPTLVIASVLGLALMVLLIARPLWGVYLLPFAVPYESLRTLNFGGLNATITELIAFSAGVAFLFTGFFSSRIQIIAPVNRGAGWWLKPLGLLAIAMFLSLPLSEDLKSSLKEMLKLGEMILTYVLVLSYVDTPQRLRRLILLIGIAAASQALLGVGQTVLHFGPSSFARGAVLRGSGTFDQPNPFAGYLNLTMPLLLASMMTKDVRLLGRWTLPVLGLLCAAILLSVSRGALLASLLAAAVIIAVSRPQLRSLIGMVIGTALLVVEGSIVGFLPSSLGNSILTTFGLDNVDILNPTPITWPVAERLAHVVAGWNMFLDHPLVGVGIGNYPTAYPQYQVSPLWAAPLGHAHNYYVNIAAEAGIVGLAAFLLVLVSAFIAMARYYRVESDPFVRTLALGGLGVLATVAVHSFFDDIFVHAMETQVALVMGIATVGYQLTQAEKKRPETLPRGFAGRRQIS